MVGLTCLLGAAINVHLAQRRKADDPNLLSDKKKVILLRHRDGHVDHKSMYVCMYVCSMYAFMYVCIYVDF
jgi:hypothetical protein